MSSSAANVSEWIAAPAPLNKKKSGPRAVFSEGNSVVERWNPEKYSASCVCYTAHPLPLGQVWQITVLEAIRSRWIDSSGRYSGLHVGVTSALPLQVPHFLVSGPQDWDYRDSSMWHSGRMVCTGLPNISDLKAQQTVGLLLSEEGNLHVYLNGRYVQSAASGLPVDQPLWGAVDLFDRCTKIRSELLTNPTENYLTLALDEGYIPHKDDLFLIHGPGGVGKSSLISMFLGKERDLVRVSTAVAEESLHLCPVRDVSTKTFTDKWELVDIDRQARMIAHTSQHLLSKKTDEKFEKLESETKEKAMSPQMEGDTPSIESSDEEEEHSGAFLKASKLKKSGFSNFTSRVAKKLSRMFAKSLTKSMGDDPDNIEGIFVEIQENLHELMHESKENFDFLVSYSVRVLDSGGQPQFHEVVSIILPAITGIVSVFKLSEPFDAHGEVVFYKAGIEANDPYKSYLTNEQVIRHDLLAIRSEASYKDMENTPNLAFVGTFLDEVDKCSDESPDQKDERLHSMITEILPETMQQCVVSNSGSLKQVTFRLNTRKPSEGDYQTVARLKEALMTRSRVKPRNLPLKWCGYELALRKLMEKLGRQTLSLQECEFIGHKLGFDPPSLKACLHYFRQLHIITFYDVLPHIIFASAQVILDKITELVTYSLELKKGNCAVLGIDRKFHQQGILSLEILQSDACSKHYRRGLFSPEDLLMVLKSLLIVTEVGKGEYLMPCVLEVSDIYPSPPVPKGSIRSSFVLHFSKKSPMIGIYCCTISYLLTKAGWKLLTEGGEVVQVARNCVTFQLPQDLPGKLTFLDPLSSYLEVVVELPGFLAAKLCKKIYCKVRDTFFAAVNQAMETLNYEVRMPELTFLCPEQDSQCSTLPHIASINVSLNILTCSISPASVVYPLTPEQKMWLPDSDSTGTEPEDTYPSERASVASPLTVLSEKPTLPELLKMEFPLKVRDKYNSFGVLLLNDRRGDKMAVIKHDCGQHAEAITREILRKWLRGEGVSVSWESLISTLRQCELSFLAHQIETALKY